MPFWNVLGRPFEAEALQQEAARVARRSTSWPQEVLGDGGEEPVRVDREPRKPKPQQPGEIYEPEPDDLKEVVQSLELFQGSELDRFFAQLGAATRGKRGRSPA